MNEGGGGNYLNTAGECLVMNHLGSLSQAQTRLAGLSKDQRLCVIPRSAITRMHFEELSGRDSDNSPPGKCAARGKEKDPGCAI